MNSLQLLLVEDDDRVLKVYQDAVESYIEDKERQIDLHISKTLDDAKKILSPSFDVAIVDLNLGDGVSDGEEVINKIKELFRIPVAILTGTPESADNEPPVVRVFTKGTHEFQEILDLLWEIHEIGLTKIMGGRGELEKRLNEVFLTNLVPSIYAWLDHGRIDKDKTEKALLRFALGHLVAELESDQSPFYPEEVYLAPPLDLTLKTGSLVRLKEKETVHLVITPACDLVPRDSGSPKTDVIVVAEIIPEVTVFAKFKANDHVKDRLRSNNYTNYYHCLPNCDSTTGGFIDFRRLVTVHWHELDNKIERLNVCIAPSFLKDIVSRFSTFYARQGQPTVHQNINSA